METITKIQLKSKVGEQKERYFGRGSHFSFVDRDVVSAHDNETRCRRHFCSSSSSSSSELEMPPIRLYKMEFRRKSQKTTPFSLNKAVPMLGRWMNL